MKKKLKFKIILLLFCIFTSFMTTVNAKDTINNTYKTDVQTTTVPSLVNGQVFVDKSVSRQEVVVDGNNFTSNDYIVQLTTMTKQCVENQKPVDVVFVLDVTQSTGNSKYGTTTGNKCMDDMVMAINECIQKILDANEQNRVAVLTYSGGYVHYGDVNGQIIGGNMTNVLLPLGHYTNSSWTEDISYTVKAGTGNMENGTYKGGEIITGKYISMYESAYEKELAPDKEYRSVLDNISDPTIRESTYSDGITYSFRLESNTGLKNGNESLDKVKVYGGWSGTYTQMGMSKGTELLLNNSDSNHDPVIMLLTDGEANMASKVNNYNYTGNLSERYVRVYNYNSQNDTWSAYPVEYSEIALDLPDISLVTFATSVYCKEQLINKFGNASIYTTAMTLDSQWINVLLNPDSLNNSFSDTDVQNTANKIKQLFSSQSSSVTSSDGVVIRNNTGTTDYNYAKYSTANNVSDLSTIFNDMTKDMISNACGDIQFIDTLGDYMELKDVLGIVKDGVLYKYNSISQNSGVKTYNFNELEDFTLQLNGNEVYVKVPEKYNTSLIRVVFTVGLKSDLNLMDSQVVKSLVDNGAYNSTSNKFNFYTNKWSTNGSNSTISLFTITENNTYYNTLPSNVFKKENITETYSNVSTFSKDGRDITVTLGNNGKQEVEVTTDITISKIWNDQNNKYSLRPSKITVKLLQGDKEYATYTISSSDNWKETIEGLPKYDAAGDEYVYTVKEEDIVINSYDKYISNVSGTTITNTLQRSQVPITVKYVDEDGNEIATSKQIKGYVNEEYNTDPVDIDGYVLASTPYNKSGYITDSPITVVYQYKKLLKTEPNVTMDKTAEWVDIENGIAKINLKEIDTVEEKVDLSDYLIIYDVSGSMPIVTVNGYEPGTYNIDVSEIVNIGCKNPNHYSKLKPGAPDNLESRRNAYHYDNNGTPNDTSDDILLNYTSQTYKKKNWKGDVIQTFNLSAPKDFMYSRENGCYSSLDTSQKMINQFVDETLKYDSNTKFAYIAFAGDVVKSNTFTTGEKLKEFVNNSTQYVGTNYVPPIEKAKEIISSYKGDKELKVIFITDGENDDSCMDAVQELKSQYDFELYSVSADYNASTTSDIYRMGDKYLYLQSNNIDKAVNDFINYSLNRDSIKAINKVYADKINSEYFEVLNSGTYKLPENVTLSGDTITWNIPDNTSSNTQEYSASIYVKLKDEYRKTSNDTLYETNLDTPEENGAKLTYSIEGGYYNSESRTLTKESPKLPYGLEKIDVTKVWEDYENEYNTRPDFINVSLNKNGTKVDNANIASNINSYSFPGYKEDNGNLVVYGLLYGNDSKKVNNTYTVTENSVNNYNNTQTGDKENIYTIKNVLNMESSVEVRYVDKNGNEISTRDNYTGKVGAEYTTISKSIDGYILDSIPSNASGRYNVDKIIVTYEYRKLSDVTVKYVDENTGKEIPGVDNVVTTYKEGDAYTTEKKNIEGYEYTKDSGNLTGKVGRENIEVVYYYKKTAGGVEVKYIDQVTGEEIAPNETISGLEKEPYETQAKEVNGYELVLTPTNARGEMTVEKITVTYEYRKLSDVTVKYVDENTGKEITGIDNIVTTYKEGDAYTTEKKSIEGYEYTKDSGNTTGKVGRENIEVVYYYKKTAGGVEVKYIDQVTGEEIATSETLTGLEKDPYETEAKEVSGYELVLTPANANGEMTVDKITVTYEYRKLSDVTVKYVDENTGKEIPGVDNVVTTYKEGDAYTTEKKNIEGYEYTKDSGNLTGKVGRENIEVVYYYKKTAGGVEVKYIDQVTGEEIATSETLTGLEKDPYETEAKEVSGYKLVLTPTNASGEMTVDKITVTYEYRKLSDVTTRYIDVNTGYDIIEEIVDTYKQGDTYTTEEKGFEGYKMVSKSNNTEGTVEREDIEVVYYYKKISSGVEVRYIDQVTKEIIYPTENITGLENDYYETQSKEIDGYELVVTPENAIGKMTVDKIVVTYEYRKLSDVTVKYIDANTGKSIVGDIVTTYKEGDRYQTEEKIFGGYELVSKTDNTEGEVGREDIEVIYEYKKIAGGVEVKYIDQVTGEEIAPKEEMSGLEKDPYETQAKEVEGYELVLTPANASGEMTVDKITVTYEYRKIANVIIEHIDGNTGEKIIEDVVTKYKEGDKYEALGQSIEGYTITKEPENKTGEVGREDIIVVYEYKKISEGLVVKYVDEITNEIMDTEEYTGNENDVIKLEEKAFNGYILTKRPEEKEVSLTVEPQEKIFYYRKIVNITIVGIDANTKEEIYTKVQTGIEGNEYQTIPEEIPGYEVSKVPENAQGTYTREETKVVYEYKKISGGVKVSYIDKETGEVLKEYRIDGLVGDKYKTEKEEIEKYNYVGVEGEERGELEEKEKEVKYYYEKKRGIVEVIYVDEEGKELYKEEMEGKVDEEYKVEEKEIENYRIKERPENAQGVYEEGRIVVKYVMERIRGTVIVNFVDKEGNKLKDQERVEGYVGEEYDLKAPEIEGYRVVENEEIKVKYIEGEQVINVVYEKIEEAPQTGDMNIYIYIGTIVICGYVLSKILKAKIN